MDKNGRLDESLAVGIVERWTFAEWRMRLVQGFCLTMQDQKSDLTMHRQLKTLVTSFFSNRFNHIKYENVDNLLDLF